MLKDRRTPRSESEEERRAAQEDREAQRVPHVILYSNGDLTPFNADRRARRTGAQRAPSPSNDEGVIESGDVVEGKT